MDGTFKPIALSKVYKGQLVSRPTATEVFGNYWEWAQVNLSLFLRQ